MAAIPAVLAIPNGTRIYNHFADECVALANHIHENFLGGSFVPVNSAYQWWTGNYPQVNAIYNRSSTPVAGSIFVSRGGPYNNTDGHIGYVTSVNPNGTFNTLEQNAENSRYVARYTRNMSGVYGFLVPKNNPAPPAPSRKDPDMARILNMRQTNDGKNNTATIFFDGGPGIGIKGIASPQHLVLLQRFLADKPGDHMYPAELAIIQTYLAPQTPTLTAATVEAAVAKAIKASGGSVEAAKVAAAVEATLKDDFAAIPASVANEQSKRLQS